MNISSVELFEKISDEVRLKTPSSIDLEKKTRHKTFITFSIITFLYVFFEFFYNKALLNIASGTPSDQTMDAIEWLGRTMAGVGCALVITRYRIEKTKSHHEAFNWKGFVVCLALSIPLMWMMQEVFIRSVVKLASEQTLEKSVISMAGRQAYLSPVSPQILPEDLLSENEKNEIKESKKTCKQPSDWMNASDALDGKKTFLALIGIIGLNNPVAQMDMKSSSMRANECMIKESPLAVARQYKNYQDSSQSFDSLKSNYKEASEKIDEYAKSKWVSSRKVESTWRYNVDKFFGFSTTIPWGLSPSAFDAHPDVAKLIGDRSGFGVPISMGLNTVQFKSKLLESMNVYANAETKDYSQHGHGNEKGQKAYKAVLVPLIGLCLSLFFGIFNASMFVLSTFAYLANFKVIKGSALVVALAIVFAPFLVDTAMTETVEHRTSIRYAMDKNLLLGVVMAWTAQAENAIE